MTIPPRDPIYTANPRAGYLAYKAEIDAAIQDVLASPHYILGPAVEHFEAAFARFIGVSHGVGVHSGTDALHLALTGLGIGRGDEVITVSHTSVATVAAIEMSGANPVLVDVELPWFTIDPRAAANAIGPRTRAVLAVHLYGQPANLAGLQALCERHGLAQQSGTSLLVYLIKPLVENPAARPLQPFAKAGRILTDRARGNFRFTKFNRVANQPGFDALRLRLDVKLNSEQIRPFPECLGRAMTRECKILASRR